MAADLNKTVLSVWVGLKMPGLSTLQLLAELVWVEALACVRSYLGDSPGHENTYLNGTHFGKNPKFWKIMESSVFKLVNS